MGAYQVVSLDMFQTLVDVNKRIPQIWQGVLGSHYTEELAAAGAGAISSCFPPAYGQAIDFGFLTMEEVYNLCSEGVVKQMGLMLNAAEVSYHIMLQHGYTPFYEDVFRTLDKIRRYYRIIISSDSNHLMVDPLLKSLDYEAAFISDDIKFYKGDKEGNFFKRVLSELDIAPDKILHIGDSYADIAGAQKAGIAACWINREDKLWNYSIRPDYIIHSLDQLTDILL